MDQPPPTPTLAALRATLEDELGIRKWEHWKRWTRPGGAFFRACHHTLHRVGRWSDEAAWWLRWVSDARNLGFVPGEVLGRHHATVAALHLRCVRALLADEDPVVRVPAPGAELPRALVADLSVMLASDDGRAVRPARWRCRTPLLLVNRDRVGQPGVALELELAATVEGTGVLYVHPALAFVLRDQGFRAAERQARAHVERLGLWPATHDVRWSLPDISRYSFQTLSQPSAGAAFALGLSKLLLDLGR